tara:strand:+ start:432 stop:776 length:345 start_codon:yes stop_codon:yes gene_type:complete
MKNESITLRKQPILKFLFNENNFEIVNNADKNDNGIYSYELLDSVELKKERTNWLISFLSMVVEVFTSSGLGDFYKEKNKLEIRHKKKHLRIILSESDLTQAELITRKLKIELK